MPRTRQPEPGLAGAVAAWARGAAFATVLEVAGRDVGRARPGRLRAHGQAGGRPGRAGRPWWPRTRPRPRRPTRRGTCWSATWWPPEARCASATAERAPGPKVAGHVPLRRRRPSRADEEAILRRYVTNLDQPVFALVNLPEVVKGALFARYSRSPKSLRRLFLDEFVGDLDISGDATIDATVGPGAGRGALRAGLLRVRRRLGGPARRRPPGLRAGLQRAHQDPRAGPAHGLPRAVDPLHRLRQPARRAATTATTGRPRSSSRRSGARYVGDMDRMFDTYAELLPRVQAWLASRYPRQPGDSDFVHRQAIRAKALDALRGLLPAASLSNVGIYGTGQSYEQLLLRMRAHPLPEARSYAEHDADRAAQGHPVVPPAGRPARAGRGVVGLPGRPPGTRRPGWSSACWPDGADGAEPTPSRRPRSRLLDFDPEGEDKVLAAICFPHLDLLRGRGPAPGPGPVGRGADRPCCAAYVGRPAATAATGRAGPSSGPTTASRWSPTTAPSGTCSATAC